MKAAVTITGILLALAAPASAFDLKADWSDLANPNGPWSYRVGGTILPHTDNWTAGTTFPVPQPAYLPVNAIGQFLPAWFQVVGDFPGFDTQVGDIVVHTNDSFNGNLAMGHANVLFTVPQAGTYHIFGNLWNASTLLVPSDFRPRPQDWRLLVNGVAKDSGVLDAIPGHFSRNTRTNSICSRWPSTPATQFSSTCTRTRPLRRGSLWEPI